MSKSNIFRQTSIDRLSSPEQLDKLIMVTSRRGWVALIALGLLLVTSIIWGIYGSIPTKVDGQGILIKSGGVRNVVHTSSGRITDIRVEAGDQVRQGDVVARIDRYDLIPQIIDEQRNLEILQQQHSNEPNPELAAQILNAQTLLRKLQEEYTVQSSIVSPFDGKVLEVQLNSGDILTSGVPLISVELEGAAIREEGLLYVSPYEGQKLRPGMEVKLAPSFVRTEEYGFMLGRVISVSEFPATFQRMLSVLGSQELVSMFSAQGAPIEVRVELITNSSNVSGYEWSSPEGPPVKINSGTILFGSIVTGTQRPLEIVLPIKVGGDSV